MDLRMKCRQKCQGDPWQMMSTAEKEMWAGRPPTFPFLPWSSSAFPLEFLSAFHMEIHGNSLSLSNANANENDNANAICF